MPTSVINVVEQIMSLKNVPEEETEHVTCVNPTNCPWLDCLWNG